ncbi:DUF4372 domain-containing protein [Sphingobacterium sp. 1304]|uniref:DUF4372 domain-containing protein n=1 Tax=Sphingobacterium sp. 2149 TaxID=2817763 RepID=UPI001AE13FF1
MVNIKVLSRLLSKIDRDILKKPVSKHNSDKHHKGLNIWTHLMSILFCYHYFNIRQFI